MGRKGYTDSACEEKKRVRARVKGVTNPRVSRARRKEGMHLLCEGYLTTD